jgi:hypothetical protein
MGNLNSVDEFLRGFKEENHVLGLVSRKGKELGGRLESCPDEYRNERLKKCGMGDVG